MKKKWIKHIGIFLCVFAICAIALYGAWRIWLDPYRGTVSTFEQSKKLDTVLTGMQAAQDLEFMSVACGSATRLVYPACQGGSEHMSGSMQSLNRHRLRSCRCGKVHPVFCMPC